MGENLSPAEIESLLARLHLDTSSSEASSLAEANSSVDRGTLYDFAHPEPLRRSQLDSIRLAAASASQALQRELSRALQNSIQLLFVGVEQATYCDFLATAESPGCIVVLRTHDAAEPWLLDINPGLAFTFVDCLLGGKPADTTFAAIPARPCTELEARLIERILQGILPELSRCFATGESLKVEDVISAPLRLAEAASNSAVALVNFEVQCESKQGLLQLCIPWKQVAGLRRLSGDDRRDIRAELRGTAVKIPVMAVAEITRLTLSTGELAGLCPGDVLLTEKLSSDEIVLRVDDCEVFRGRPGQSQNRKAIRLTVTVPSVTKWDKRPDESI